MARITIAQPTNGLSIDFTAPDFDPNDLLKAPKSPANFTACLLFANHGHVYHMNRVASYYEEGEFVPQDLEKAAIWYKKSADRSNPHALRKMGDFYRDGIGVRKDPDSALICYHLAASQKWAPALFELGRCYEEGIGCEIDPEKALQCYEEAAAANNKKAIARLAEIKRNRFIEELLASIETSKSDEDESDESSDEEEENEEEYEEDEYASPGFVGNCCFHCSVADFQRTDRDDWIRRMRSNYSRVTSHALDSDQIAAWRDCHAKLVPALNELCNVDAKYGVLELVFEYVMPCRRPPFDDLESDPGRRADVVLVSSETVVCLEFKRYNVGDLWPGAIRQARMYPRKLRRYHAESIGKTKKGILVLTRARGYDDTVPRLRICSPDCLADAIHDCFRYRPVPVADLNAWIASEWRERE